jgi:hypothetical protein
VAAEHSAYRGRKVAKNVVPLQATLRTPSASCRASRSVRVGALFSFLSVPSLRVLLSFLKQCFSYMRSGAGDLSRNTPPHPSVRDVFNSHAFLRGLVAGSSSDGAIWSHGTASRT